ITTTTAAVTVDMMAVAAIISSSDKPRSRFLTARLRNITHQLGDFRCHYYATFARIHRAVAVVVAIRRYRHDHQLANDSTIDHRIGAGHAVSNSRLAVRCEIPGNRTRGPSGAYD